MFVHGSYKLTHRAVQFREKSRYLNIPFHCRIQCRLRKTVFSIPGSIQLKDSWRKRYLGSLHLCLL